LLKGATWSEMRPGPRAPVCRAIAAVLLQLAIDDGGRACAQIYHFKAERVPQSKSLVVKQPYFVYNHKDAPENRFGNAFVKFHDLGITGPGNLLMDYRGIQLSLLKANRLGTLINSQGFCCEPADVHEGTCSTNSLDQLLTTEPKNQNNETVYTHTVHFHPSDLGAKTDARMTIRDTGVYILVVSNCGRFDDAWISGSVAVKNPYGFLPGSDYPKLRFYEWLSIAYMAMGLVWVFLSVRYFKALLSIHYCVCCVMFLGLIEGFLQYCFLSDWNSRGVQSNTLFFLTEVAGVAKLTFSNVLVLATSLGWNVTRPYLDKDICKQIRDFCVAYIFVCICRVAAEIREGHAYSKRLKMPFLVLAALPETLLSGFIFYWILSALLSLIESLKERKRMEQLLLFKRLWSTIVIASGVAVVVQVAQFVSLSNSTDKWMYQWRYKDGFFQVLFVLVLVVTMFLWAPHKNSQSYTYTPHTHVAKDEAEAVDGGPTSASGKGGSSAWVDEETGAHEGENREPAPLQLGRSRPQDKDLQ